MWLWGEHSPGRRVISTADASEAWWAQNLSGSAAVVMRTGKYFSTAMLKLSPCYLLLKIHFAICYVAFSVAHFCCSRVRPKHNFVSDDLKHSPIDIIQNAINMHSSTPPQNPLSE